MNKQYKRLATPYIIWLSILVFIPTLGLIVLGFTNFTSNISLTQIQFTLENISIFKEDFFLSAFKNSLMYATLTTFISFVLGYILAYIIYKSKFKNKFIIVVIMILPMWSNLVLRIDAFANIMSTGDTILNNIIGFSPFEGLIKTPAGILIGMVFTYIPFMILPIYTALEKIDPALYEASSDLGITPVKTVMFVTFPLSFKGVVSGAIMVFLPTFSGFVIPNILDKGTSNYLGTIIEKRFTYFTYNDGALLSSSILLFIFLSMFLLNRFDKEGETLL